MSTGVRLGLWLPKPQHCRELWIIRMHLPSTIEFGDRLFEIDPSRRWFLTVRVMRRDSCSLVRLLLLWSVNDSSMWHLRFDLMPIVFSLWINSVLHLSKLTLAGWSHWSYYTHWNTSCVYLTSSKFLHGTLLSSISRPSSAFVNHFI